VTLAELRHKLPLCGVPCTNRQLYLGRVDAVEKRHWDDWWIALAKVGAGVDTTEVFLQFPTNMSVLFNGGKYNENLHKRFAKRLRSMPEREFANWVKATVKILSADTSIWSLALTLVAVDPLFDKADHYVPERAGKYLKRPQGLSIKHIALWVRKIRVYGTIPDDAALSIMLIDDFFDGDRFNEKVFNEVLR